MLGAVTVVACGPVEYLSQVSGRASSALLQAQRAEADRLAPYELTKASAYYTKALEEGSESSFQVAVEYGKRAEEFAQRATAVARERSAAARGGP